MRRLLFIVVMLIAILVITISSMYYCALRKQRSAMTLLSAMTEIKMGATTKEELSKKLSAFNAFKSTTVSSSCFEGQCYKGVGYGIDNSSFGRIFLFPKTNLAVGVYFDSNNTVQGIIVSIDRLETATVTLESQPVLAMAPQGKWPTTNDMSVRRIHRRLEQSQFGDIVQLNTSCFTSWVGCSTAHQLMKSSE